MIKVTVELVSAITKKTTLLGIAKICNDGKTSKETNGLLGSYNVILSKWYPKQNLIWKKGTVKNFNRKERGVWDLLYLALENIVGNRNFQHFRA